MYDDMLKIQTCSLCKWIIQSCCVLLYFFYQSSNTLLGGVEALSPHQILSDGDVLISPGQMFEVGFFSPGKSINRFLGVWYKATPDVVIWVANRNDPIMDSTGVLTLSANGSLVISTTPGGKIWSSEPSRPASSPVLQLLETGNLVVVENSVNIWESFDYPTDSAFPGKGIFQDPVTGESRNLTSWTSADDPSCGEYNHRVENNGLSQIIFTKGKRKLTRVVFWNGFLTGIPNIPDPAWRVEVMSNGGRVISVTRPSYKAMDSRMTLSYTGIFEHYIMNERKDGWTFTASLPRDLCDNYGHCGHNSICRIYNTPICECLRGFQPTAQDEWRMFNWKRGCTRNLSSNCQKDDGFLKIEGIKLPDSLNYLLNMSMSTDDCHDECLKRCDCTAYADPYFSNGSSCLMWFGNLIDIKEQFEKDGGGPILYLRVPVSELGHLTHLNKIKGKVNTRMIIITAASGFGMFILGSSFGGLFLWKQLKRQASKKISEEFELPLFDFATIASATNNFSEENLIGEGGFGPVYKANLSSEEVVAVKRMSKTSGQGHHEFRNEVTFIAKLQHRNLIKILGCCIERDEKILIYDYMHNKSLDYFIFDQERKSLLTWPKRLEIILGIARGLLYLHHDSRLTIIHRDLKTSNILLDENLNAKISDFGLARMFGGNQTTARTRKIVGTYGYMAPEYAFDGKFSIKSDVFSMGVVILEIVSGKKNRGSQQTSFYNTLLGQAWQLWNEEREIELTDPCYNNSYMESQVKRCIHVALLCVQNNAEERPVMSSVLLMLSTDDMALPQPQKPGFFLQDVPQSNETVSKKSSRVSITISDVEAR